MLQYFVFLETGFYNMTVMCTNLVRCTQVVLQLRKYEYTGQDTFHLRGGLSWPKCLPTTFHINLCQCHPLKLSKMAPLAQIEHRGLAIWVLQMWPTLRASEVAGATNHRKTNTSFKKHKFRILSSSLFTSHVQSWDHARRSCTTRAINLA